MAETKNKEVNSMGIEDLPKGCLEKILSLTTPRDVCRAAAVSSTFNTVSLSNLVWGSFIPNDSILVHIVEFLQCLVYGEPSTKDLFMDLSRRPIYMKNDGIVFNLSKSTGKVSYFIPSNKLSIAWGDDPNYWQRVQLFCSRFLSAAELLRVCWFDVRYTLDVSMLSPSTRYAVNLVFNLDFRSYGFQEHPVEAEVSINGGEASKRKMYLCERPSEEDESDGDAVYGKLRSDLWLEVKLGEICYSGEGEGKVDIRVSETRSLHWKSRIVIEGIEITVEE